MRKYLLLMAAAAAIFASCGRPAKKAETPSAQEFAPYIKAYTGGMVPQDAELRIDLMQEVQGVAPAGLFSANPGIKGTVRWNSPSSVSFLPEPGALEPGKTYNISFHLEKLWADAPAFVYPIVAKGSTESGAILVPDSGFNQACEERMCVVRSGAEFRVSLCTDEEGMILQFDHLHDPSVGRDT